MAPYPKSATNDSTAEVAISMEVDSDAVVAVPFGPPSLSSRGQVESSGCSNLAETGTKGRKRTLSEGSLTPRLESRDMGRLQTEDCGRANKRPRPTSPGHDSETEVESRNPSPFFPAEGTKRSAPEIMDSGDEFCQIPTIDSLKDSIHLWAWSNPSAEPPKTDYTQQCCYLPEQFGTIFQWFRHGVECQDTLVHPQDVVDLLEAIVQGGPNFAMRDTGGAYMMEKRAKASQVTLPAKKRGSDETP